MKKPIRVLVKASTFPERWVAHFATWREAEAYCATITIRATTRGAVVQTAILDDTQHRRTYPAWWIQR